MNRRKEGDRAQRGDQEILIEQELRNIYYDPSEEYQSAEKFYQKAKEQGLNVSRKAVRNWLKTQDTYTRYKPIVRKHKYRKTYVRGLADQMQLDLVDMGKYGSKNKGYRWILTAVEILSRYAFAIPVYRKDTENIMKAVGVLLERDSVNIRTSFNLTKGKSFTTSALKIF